MSPMGRLISKITFNDQARWIEIAQLSDFRSARLARHLGLSRRQVERYIRRHFALSPQQWLRQLRMARAGELIRVMHSVKEVAYALGFSQVSSFCRQFKAHYGVTCSEYAALISSRQCIEEPKPDSQLAIFDWDRLTTPPPPAQGKSGIAIAG